MSTTAIKDFMEERKALFGVSLFVLFLTYKVWIYAISGLRNKKITVWHKGFAVTTLEGKKAKYYSLFWLVAAIILTFVLVKFFYLFLKDPRDLL